MDTLMAKKSASSAACFGGACWIRRSMLPSCKQAPGTQTTCIRRNL
nr:MAG TPA: hypothetical protein [Caudoviricetes sp.]